MAAAKRFPSGAEYVEALQNPQLCFRDPELQAARPQTDALGRPKPISGNFASVFSLATASGERFAIKCFTREIADQEKRYLAVSDHLRSLPGKWKIGFEFLPSGIMVGGRRYPILRMEWVEAVSLIRWIEGHLGDQDALLSLAGRFAELAADLDEAGIAHGDLQHGNLLVAADGSVRLVDYDGMYVPALAGLPATEQGHRHYQAPNRATAEFGPELDRFSNWLIYLSLVAIGLDPSLWQTLHEPDGEHLLLMEADLTSPSSSSRMAALRNHHVQDVSRLATHVADLSTRPLSAMPALIPLPPIAVSPSVAVAPPAAASTASAGSLPSWMAGHIPPPATPAPVVFSDHRGVVRRTRLVLLGLAVLTVLSIVLLGLPALASGAVAGIGLALALATARALSASLPERQAHKAVLGRHKAAHERTTTAAKAMSSLERERTKRQADDTKRTQSQTRQLQEIRQRHRHAVESFDRATAERLAPFNARIQALSARKSTEVANALQQAQEAHITAYLKRFTLRAGHISGIGDATVANLWAHGISTPADFIDVEYAYGSHQQKPEVHLVLADGRYVRVNGVGEARAVALLAWRNAHLDGARRQPGMPTSPPRSVLQQIESRYTAELRQIEGQRDNAHQARTNQRATIVQTHTQELRQLTDQHRTAAQSAVLAAADINQRIAGLQVEHQSAAKEEQMLTRELQAFQQVSFGRFLRQVVIGGSAS